MRLVKHDLEERKYTLFNPFKQIRLHLIIKEDLIKFVSNERLIFEDKQCNEYLVKTISYHTLLDDGDNSTEEWSRTRRIKHQETMIYIIGGHIHTKTRHVLEKLKIDPFSSVLLKVRRNWLFNGAAFLENNFIILIGGLDSNKVATNRVSLIDSQGQTLHKLPALNIARYRFGTAVINNEVYVCGGMNENGYILSSVESYKLGEKSWVMRTPMTTPRWLHAAVTLGDNIYCIGGADLRSVGMYEPGKDIWTPIAPLPTKPARHGAAIHDGKIYVVGGQSSVRTTNTSILYSPQCRKWVLGPKMNHARQYPLLVDYWSKLYVLGGWNEPHGYLTSIEEFNFNHISHIFSWTKLERNISVPRFGAVALVVRA